MEQQNKYVILSKFSDRFIALNNKQFTSFVEADNYLEDYLIDTYKENFWKLRDDYVVVNDKFTT